MAKSVVLSSVIIEGSSVSLWVSKSKVRSVMDDDVVSSCLSTWVAKATHADLAIAFKPNPVLADEARKHRLQC